MSRDERRALAERIAGEMAELQLTIDMADGAVAEHLGVNRTDRRCLEVLVRRGPLTASQISQAVGLTLGSVTAMVDRLVRAGYVTRRRDPQHGRRVLVAPTQTLERIVADLFAEHIASGFEQLAGYSDEQLETIRDFVTRSRDRQAAFAVRVRARPAAPVSGTG